MNRSSAFPEPGLRVVAADGRDLGLVGRVEDGHLCLVRGSTADGRGHDIPLDWIARIEAGVVHLNRITTEEATLSALGTPRGVREGMRRALPWLLGAFLAIMLLAALLAF
jgi:hypothetical protein